MSIVGQLKYNRNVLTRFTNEGDFVVAMAHENLDLAGVPYRIFHWTPDFMEKEDSPLVPIWLTLLGLPIHLFHATILKSIGGGFGCFLKRDSANVCVMRPEVARISVEVDVSVPLRHSFWLSN